MESLLKNTNAYKLLSARKGSLRHAYLLLFPDGKNLRKMLRAFAPLFFAADGVASGAEDTAAEKRIAALIEKEGFADCLFFPEEGKKFTVENAAAVEEECSLRPVEGERKLFVIGDFSEATKEAQNKLLKMLEEPPESVSFLLGATSSFSVLPTVLSRVEKLEIPPFSVEEITAYLKRNVPGITNAEAALCAGSSGGIAGKAYDLSTGGYFHELLNSAYDLCFSTVASLPALVRQCGETKYKKELLSLLKIIFFDAAMYKMRCDGMRSGSENAADERIKKISSEHSYGSLLKAQKILTDAEKQLYFNGIFAQILEISVSKIISLKNG